MQETLRQALAELAAASEREYLNDGADREETERYFADRLLQMTAPSRVDIVRFVALE